MNRYPIIAPSKLECLLFDAGLLKRVPLAEIYDIKSRTTIQSITDMAKHSRLEPDIHDPSQWDDGNPHAWMRWEFFSYVLKDCRRVLDVGCGDGWPSIYIARRIPEVVGLDISPGQIELAKKKAEIIGLSNVRFEAMDIRSLSFPDESFDGVCFGGNALTYGSDQPRILRELHRVLKPGGVFVFEQRPVDPDEPAGARVSWFIDGGPPIAHYVAHKGGFSREVFVFIRSHTEQGKRLIDAATRMSGELTDEQRRICEDIRRDIESGQTDIVERAIYDDENHSPSAEEFPRMLKEAGFADFRSWGLPGALEFARELQEQGILGRLRQEDLIPFMHVLIRSAPRYEKWIHEQCTCRKRE